MARDAILSSNSKVRNAVIALAGAAACGGLPDTPSTDAGTTDELAPELRFAVEAGLDHLETHAARLGLRGRGDLSLVRAFTDELDLTHARFQQTIHGVPVFGGEGIVHLRGDGSVSALTDAFVSAIAVDTAPKLSAEQAIGHAVPRHGCASCLTAPPTSDLWILRHGGKDHLVWRVQLRIEDGSPETALPVMFIDAHDGELVWQYDNLQTGSGPSLYSGTVTLDTTPHAGLYYMEDLTRRLGTFDLRNDSSMPYRFEDADDVFDGVSQRAGLDAHWGALKTYEYLKNVHDRNGIDGNGGPISQLAVDGVTRLITSRVHYGSNYNNAFWNGTVMTYGDGDGSNFSPLVSIDVAGHEMMHGVTQHTAALVYAGESGALNESYSDVFGALVERYARGDADQDAIWKIGDEIYTPATPGDALRYMESPHQASNKGFTADDDPDHYSERYTGPFDNGGVHINSGVVNKTFHLLAAGGSHHLGGSMTGIGADKAAAIWYRALTTYMTSSTSFVQAAHATYNAAVALHGAESPEAAAVVTAWGLTGIIVDLEAPEAAITAPVDGATVVAPMVVTASATDNVGVTSVQFLVDGALLATDTTSPFGFHWDTLASGNGTHTLAVKAFDAAGYSTQSAAITVTVDHETVPPVVAIAAPADGATVAYTVIVTAHATDNVAVARVELLVDGDVVANDPWVPYSFAWNTRMLANGPHTLAARAFDTAGNSATSAPITVTVDNDHTPPVVAITAPAPGSTVTGTVLVTADASDNVGVTRIDFLLNGVLVGTDTAAPYELTWNTLATGNGAYSLVARAYDAPSNSASSAVTVTASNPGLATYDATLKVPRCAAEGNVCDTGAMVNGRNGKGPEPNAPNTLGGTCLDGTSGTYHGSQSLDRLRVFTSGGQPIAAGEAITIEATVWLGSGNDTLDLFHTVTPSSPVWTRIGSLSPTAAGTNTLSKTFTLPGGAQQAIRGQFRNAGSPLSTCDSGSYNDRDDLVFAVVQGPDTTAPAASITAPAAGAVLRGRVTFAATATDTYGVTAVEFRVDGALVATDPAAPYLFVWNTATVADGAHTLAVRALDPSGNAGQSAPVGITVHNIDVAPPTTSITSPAAGAVVSDTVTVTTSSSDDFGVKAVELLLDGNVIATATSAPWSFSWDTRTAANRTHSLQSRARDAAGNIGPSTAINVIVDNGIGTAAFDPVLQAPRCAVGYDGCDTGTLVDGRGAIGPEPNAPNTLHDSCGDGGAGGYHASSSIDRLRVFTADGTPLAQGNATIIEATVWSFHSLFEQDVIDFYYTTSPSSPSWVHIGSITPGSPQGIRVVSTSFTLPPGGQIAVRANMRRKPLLGSNTPSTCTAGQYNDRDDLVFTVGDP